MWNKTSDTNKDRSVTSLPIVDWETSKILTRSLLERHIERSIICQGIDRTSVKALNCPQTTGLTQLVGLRSRENLSL